MSARTVNDRALEAPATGVTLEDADEPPRGGSRRRRRSLVVFLVLVVAALVLGMWYFLATRGRESTDDAFLAADTFRIAPKVAGRVRAVPVGDNQWVKAGELLAEIEPAEFQTRVEQARAAVGLAEAQQRAALVQVTLADATSTAGVARATAEVEAAGARLEQEQAALEAANAEAQRTRADLERYSQLSERSVSQQRLDVVRASSISAGANVRAAEKRVNSARSDVAAARAQLAAAEAERQTVDAARAEVERRQAEVRQAIAVLAEAELELSWTRVVAPAAGRVTNKAVLAGDYVQAGRTLIALVGSDVWVVANFKETQLEHLRPGQSANVHVDAYDIDLPAHVDSVQSGSGAFFSLLPPQNATGNYVKVVQRVPVKLVFDRQPDRALYLLGPGMSVVPTVRTR